MELSVYICGMEATKQVTDYATRYSKKEAYLLNNRLFTSNCISKEQYNINWNHLNKMKIINLPKNNMGHVITAGGAIYGE